MAALGAKEKEHFQELILRNAYHHRAQECRGTMTTGSVKSQLNIAKLRVTY